MKNFLSRKLLVTILGYVAIIMVGKFIPESKITEVITAIVTLAGLYITGNSVSKIIDNKKPVS